MTMTMVMLALVSWAIELLFFEMTMTMTMTITTTYNCTSDQKSAICNTCFPESLALSGKRIGYDSSARDIRSVEASRVWDGIVCSYW